QLVQRRPAQVTVRVVLAAGAEADPVTKQIAAAVREAVPGFDVEVEAVRAIAPETNGKIRIVKVEPTATV
ncbi:phenylacetate--CoA ligase family protein, partial [Streptomyces cavourensis]|nr:phenylacetate--CoA ligase family protein [Streptomyces cavourensis]